MSVWYQALRDWVLSGEIANLHTMAQKNPAYSLTGHSLASHNILCLCLCLCLSCIYGICACQCMHDPWIHMEARGRHWVSYSLILCLILWEWVSRWTWRVFFYFVSFWRGNPPMLPSLKLLKHKFKNSTWLPLPPTRRCWPHTMSLFILASSSSPGLTQGRGTVYLSLIQPYKMSRPARAYMLLSWQKVPIYC